MIALGDKLSNVRTMHRDYQVIGEELWQRFNEKDPIKQGMYFTNYLSQAELGPHDFMMQKEEIDAEAFACSYLTELGFDGMEYSISPELFPDLHQAVKNRMNEIMTEAVVA